jgi:hypothetical protein
MTSIACETTPRRLVAQTAATTRKASRESFCSRPTILRRTWRHDEPLADPALSTPLAAPPAAVRRALTVPSRRQVHRARAHTAMGAVFTGAGIGMLGILAGVLQLERQRAGEIRGIIDAAKAEHRGYTPAEERRYFDLRDDLLRGRDVAIGVGVAGLVSLGTGVALLATRKKTRSRTYALQPYGGPQGAGAVLRLRF